VARPRDSSDGGASPRLLAGTSGPSTHCSPRFGQKQLRGRLRCRSLDRIGANQDGRRDA
jgi:hypothetical protein